MTSEESPVFSGSSCQVFFDSGSSESLNDCDRLYKKGKHHQKYACCDSLADACTENQSHPALGNKNTHNKNIVIWKDGYIVPIKHASIEIDAELAQCFAESISLYPDTLDDDNWSDFGCDDTADAYNINSPPQQLKIKRSASIQNIDNTINKCKDKNNQNNVGPKSTSEDTRQRSWCICERNNFPDIPEEFLTSEGLHSLSEGSIIPKWTSEECQQPAVSNLQTETTTKISSLGTRSCDSPESVASDTSGYIVVHCEDLEDPSHTEGRPATEKTDSYNTPPSSPCCECDRSDSNSYHTVDTSPGSNAESFSVVPTPESSSTYPNVDKVRCEQRQEVNDNEECGQACAGGQSNNAICSESNETIAIENWDVPDSYKVKYSYDRSSTGRFNHGARRHSYSQGRRGFHAPKPSLFVDAQAIQYEADPRTGKPRSVGKGSFGQVFKARFCDPRYHYLSIVVKEFDEEFTARHEILEEARRLLYLQDTGYVPTCYGVVNLGSDTNPRYGIVQEYVGTGLTLEQLLWEQCDLPLEMWLSIALQCCEGLDRFHKKGILMNDIKSNNVIPEFYQDAVSIKYIDFGLSTGMSGKRYKDTKSLEEFVYLAPEVRIDGHVTSVCSDIYSLGFMLDQVSSSAWSLELRHVAEMCMKNRPSERAMVSHAADFIRSHMIRLGCDTRRHHEYHNGMGQRYW